MFRIKILDSKNHPFTNKIKVYGISIETILITSFVFIVLFVVAIYFTKPSKKEGISPKSMQLKPRITEGKQRNTLQMIIAGNDILKDYYQLK